MTIEPTPEHHPGAALLKLLLAWLGYAVGYITLQQIVLALTGVYTMLQRAIGALPDGLLGPKTLQTLNSMPTARVVARFNGQRLAFLADNKAWATFSKGWAKRVASNLMEA